MSPTCKSKHIQKDTMTGGIKGHQEIKEGQDGYSTPTLVPP